MNAPQTDNTNLLLTRILDATALRQRVLTNNLANVNTPHFHRQDLDFQDALSHAVKQGSAANIQLEVKEDTVSPERFDGNNVQLETELSEMSKNSLQYQTAMQVLGMRMALQRMAVTGRSV